MKRPENLEQFVSMINEMRHRERFVFEAKDGTNAKYGMTCFIEVYNTILFDSRNLDRNITIHLVDSTGEILNKKAKLHRLWTVDFYKSVYSMFKIGNEIGILELPE